MKHEIRYYGGPFDGLIEEAQGFGQFREVRSFVGLDIVRHLYRWTMIDEYMDGTVVGHCSYVGATKDAN